MSQLQDGVILIDPTGTILSANAAALAMHCVASLDALGSTAEGYAERFSLRSEARRPLKHREYPLFRLLAGESFPDLVVEVAPAGEETRWVHRVRDVTMDEDGGEADYLALVISDVTERFDAEVRFKAMFQANPAPAIVVRQRDQRIVQVNPGFLALTRFSPDDVTGRTLLGLDLLQGMPDPGMVGAKIEAAEVIEQSEAELLVKDGSRRLVLFAGQPIDVTDEDAMLLTFADLEPRRQAQQAMAASERHLSTVFEMAPVAMMITDEENGQVVSVNAAFRRLTGREDDECANCTASALRLWNSAEEQAMAECDMRECGSLRNRDARLLTRDATPVDCLISAERISMQETPCVLWLFQDITERRRSEMELVEAIDAVMTDASWLSRSIMDRLATLRRPSPAAPPVNLTPRERDMLELICNDLDDAAIAERLGLSRNTIRNHVARLYTKIGVNRRSGAVVWGHERGIGSRQR